MKIKILIGPLIVEVVTIVLILFVALVPLSFVRIILGLPLLLFFPGYTLLATLFPGKERMGSIEWIALSFGMSIAIVALVGLGLNYTPWGIRLEPVLYSVAGLIIVMSDIAWIRRGRLLKTTSVTMEVDIRLPGWEGSILDKSLSIIFIVSILSAIGVLGYTVVAPKVGERFTEFYILGLNGKAQDYPTTFLIKGGQVTEVIYGDGTHDIASGWGIVALGIANRGNQTVTYSVKIRIDGKPANINWDGTIINQLDRIELRQGEIWKQQIGFAPEHLGDRQKVEFLLFKDDNSTPQNSLHLWINARDVR